jgi:tetratricopeptide (TPR) repeat protein
MRERKRLTMWRDDHIGDPVGAIFLGVDEDARPRLAEYFGPKIHVIRAEVVHNRAQVEVDCVRLAAESNQLVTAANEVRAKGLIQNADSLFREAIVLDPLNADAMLGLGLLLANRKEHAKAFAILRRAREAGGERPDLLQALAGVSVELGNPRAALTYLQRAAEVAPNDPKIRRAIASLEPKPPEDPDTPHLTAVPRNRRA